MQTNFRLKKQKNNEIPYPINESKTPAIIESNYTYDDSYANPKYIGNITPNMLHKNAPKVVNTWIILQCFVPDSIYANKRTKNNSLPCKNDAAQIRIPRQ